MLDHGNMLVFPENDPEIRPPGNRETNVTIKFTGTMNLP